MSSIIIIITLYPINRRHEGEKRENVTIIDGFLCESKEAREKERAQVRKGVSESQRWGE